MSLITRCPTCETMFKVVPDQLRVSEGWVRCGQCAEIFDATQNMVPAAEGSLAAAPPVTPPATRAPTPPAEAPRSSRPTPASPQAFFVRPPEPPTPALTPTPTPPSEPPSEPAYAQPRASTAATVDPTPPRATGREESSWVDAPATDPDTVFLGEEAEAELRTQPLTPEPVADLASLGSTAAQPAAKVDHAVELNEPTITFLRGSAKPSIWRRPAVRWTLALVALLLLVLLVTQIVRMQRDRIAAVEPATRLMLQAMCDLTGCVLAPLRQIESIVIDSSSFSRVRGDDYQLGFALRNTAPIAIAMPSIELSLTDPQDQAVIRRVVLPTEFASGVTTLAKASVWTGSLALSVRPGSQTERIAGYRLLAFYP